MVLSITEIRKSVVFAVEGRLSTLQNEVPNFSRMSPVMLETAVNSSIVLLPVQSNVPAIDPQDGSILVEPSKTNLLNYNLDVKQNVWQKGSSVSVRGDIVLAPDGSQRGDRISWSVGTGNTQIIQRQVTLKAGTKYFLSGLFRLVGGNFSISDNIKVINNVVDAPTVALSTLNSFIGNYRWIKLGFQTSGIQPKLPNTEVSRSAYAIGGVSANSVILSGITGVAIGDFIGGQVSFSNNPTQKYNIVNNTVSGSNWTITTDQASGSLVANGVTTAATASLHGAPDVVATLQMYVESAISLDWGGIQLEESSFHTSMIYQDASISSRALTQIVYRKRSNPLIGLKTFGILIDLKLWRGDGNLFNAGNIVIEILGGKLKLTVGSTVLVDPTELPIASQVYVQVSAESFTLSLFVNKKLVARSGLSGFQPSSSRIEITSTGVRCFNRIVILNRAFADGAIAVGDIVKAEMADVLFSEITDVGAVAVSVPELVLPFVTIPSPESPAWSSEIQAINAAGKSVTVLDGTGFGTSGSVIIYRPATDGDRAIGYLTITGKTGNTVTLDSVTGIALGDRLVSDFVARPGKASVRLPFAPVDPQAITSVDIANKRVTVASSLAFIEKSRAIIQSALYQDVSEVIVETVDNTNNRLTLSSIVGISVGDIISQPDEEVEIPTECYYVDLLTPNPAIGIDQKATNGFVLSNKGSGDAIIQTTVKVYL